jgi:hypothetical protein
MTQSQSLIKLVYEKGYRIKDNKCYNPKGKEIKGCIKKHPVPYKQLSIKYNKYARPIFFHSLLAYQLYGEEYFKKGIVARHLDGDSLNNSENNIVLGTMKDNILDIPSKRRSSKNKKSSETRKKLQDGMKEKIINDYKNGYVAKELYKKYDTCLNTIYLIIRSLKE